ncbi:MAG: prepilin-type N-terminal cleavage/methylation domain-containing protein [Planctomycetota bacterium]
MKRHCRFTTFVEHRIGFTLVEVLIVLAIMSALAAVALPATKELLADQKVDRAASALTAFIDSARNRAIAENRPVGVEFERFDETDEFGRSVSFRAKMLTSVPPYRGDSEAARVVLVAQTGGNVDQARIRCDFAPTENQLLLLSAHLRSTLNDDEFEKRSPIRERDEIELPGGRRVPIIGIVPRDKNSLATIPVSIFVDLRQADASGSTRYPSASNVIPFDRVVPFKIHRRPVASSSLVYTMPRGIVVDFNYSGIGVFGNNFAPETDLSVPAPDVSIVFGGDGKVINSYLGVRQVGNQYQLVESPPSGQIFICVGRSEGVHPENLFETDDDAPANLLSEDSVWLVINANTGRCFASPFASVPQGNIPNGTVTDPFDLTVAPVVSRTRDFAKLSDTIDLQ